MAANIKRSTTSRTARASDNNENVPIAKSFQQAGSKMPVLKASTDNLLKKRAKRTALSDVSNRAAPAVPQATAKQSQILARKTSLTRPVRREVLQAVVVPSIPESFESDLSAEGNMDVDAADPTAQTQDNSDPIYTNAIQTGAALLRPVYTRKDSLKLSEVDEAFVDEWDEWNDISMVQEYADDIFQYLERLEERLAPNPNYMSEQNDLEWKMRSILIDWLVQVHARFHLLPETLFLTINYIDRFLSAKSVSLQKLQLVGATALFLASKYEEIQCPSVAEIVYMVDNGYSADEVLKAERFMVGMLNFELGWPGPMSFLRRISKADDYDIDTRTIAKYLLETMLMSHLFVACPPSFAAALADYVARGILGKVIIWTDAHVYFSRYTADQIKPAADVLVRECLENAREKHGAIFDKYSDKKHKKVSLFVEAQLHRLTK